MPVAATVDVDGRSTSRSRANTDRVLTRKALAIVGALSAFVLVLLANTLSLPVALQNIMHGEVGAGAAAGANAVVVGGGGAAGGGGISDGSGGIAFIPGGIDSDGDGKLDDIILGADKRMHGTGNLSNYTFNRADPFQGFNVDLEMKDSLEFLKDIPALANYWRPERMRPSHRTPASGVEPVRVACLYAGFVRDFEKMFMTCGDMKRTHPRFCNHPKRRKFFGQQRKNLLEGTDCDVFMSTWDIRGAGRFNTATYVMNKTVSDREVRGVYGARMARLHMQNYSAYQPLWYWMSRFKRNFPQTHPTDGFVDSEGRTSWTGTAESNPFIRINDYSQSYKQWCVLQLVNRYSGHYDLYFRLRTDLRSTHQIESLRFARPGFSGYRFEQPDTGSGSDATDKKKSETTPTTEAPSPPPPPPPPVTVAVGPTTPAPTDVPSSLLTSTFYGTPVTIKRENRTILFNLRKVEDKEKKFKKGQKYKKPKREKAKLPPADASEDDQIAVEDTTVKYRKRELTHHYVHASRLHVNNFDVGDFGFMGTPEMVTELAKLWTYCIAPSELQTESVDHDDISEYNLMLWHIVFENEWQVDTGGRYLWVSRRGAMEAKKLSGGSTVLKVLRGPSLTVKQGQGSRVVVRKVKKKV